MAGKVVAGSCLLFLLPSQAAEHSVRRVDTSGWVGAEYQPSKSANQDWLFHYDIYRDDIKREVHMVKNVMGFTAFRVFLHSMIYFASPTKMISVLDDFLSITSENDIKVGFVFFDDCWNHAGLNLSQTCIPHKGVHNGCWMASPQDAERTSKGVHFFKPYVTEIINKFKDDKRVIWWEIFNEPHYRASDAYPQGNFTEALRHSGFQWALEVAPSQPIINCWDQATDSDGAVPMKRFNSQLNDHHQYNVPWGGVNNSVFDNSSGLMGGGLLTEAGARWYQGQANDPGSPLTVIDWLTKLRKNPAAPFVPGVMIDWEVMVSNSNTRWQWTSHQGDPEPAIPWHQHLFPDGSPVSYTEAAAIRRYITGKDDFLFFEDFLSVPGVDNAGSHEIFHHVTAQGSWNVNHTLADGLIEMAVWPASNSVVTLSLRSSAKGSYSVILDAAQQRLSLRRSGKVLQTFNASILENGILSAAVDKATHGSWNMLRVLVKGHEVSVWLNPMYPEAFKDSKFPLPGEASRPIQAIPPRISVRDENPLPAGTISVDASHDGALVDYLSVLPPLLYGSDHSFGAETIVAFV